MKTNLLFTGLLVCTLFSCEAKTPAAKLEKAIQESDINALKVNLKRLGELDAAFKKECVEDSEDMWELRKKEVSLSNKRDVAKFVGGGFMATIFGLAGFACIGEAVKARRNSDHNASAAWRFGGFTGFVLAAFGVQLTYNGYTCSWAQDRADLARRVFEEMRKAQEKKEATA